jgi:hypothetical protein
MMSESRSRWVATRPSRPQKSSKGTSDCFRFLSSFFNVTTESFVSVGFSAAC